jgi:3-oxoadipate enol-lactonase
MDDGFAPTGDDFLYYRQSGEGDLVVFIHAGVADSRMWIPQLEAVPDGYHFVAFDQRGFGRSKLGDGSYSDHLDAIAVLDYFSAESAVVVGCSVGARIAMQVAITAPERVSKLVLVGADSPGFEPTEPFESPQWPDAVKAFEAGDFHRAAELESEIWGAGHGRSMADVDPAFAEVLREMDLIALQSEAARDEVRDPGPEPATGIGEVSVPGLVVIGEYDIPPLVEAAHDLASKLSDREVVVIGNAAHLPPLEQPSAFNEALFSFLSGA